MIDTLENTYGEMTISVSEAVGFICLGGPAKAKLTITYNPTKKVMELISFHNWMGSEFVEQEAQPLESVARKVYDILSELLSPVWLQVIAESPRDLPGAHGPLRVEIPPI